MIILPSLLGASKCRSYITLFFPLQLLPFLLYVPFFLSLSLPVYLPLSEIVRLRTSLLFLGLFLGLLFIPNFLFQRPFCAPPAANSYRRYLVLARRALIQSDSPLL
jgi:hypothetical protein